MTNQKSGWFAEFFAGRGGLTTAVRRLKINTIEPEDLATEGLDFAKPEDIETLLLKLKALSKKGPLFLHFAPPCRTFSRARDRSWKTRLRSSECP